jgi:YggT family protein
VIAQALLFLVGTIVSLFSTALLLRFFLQVARAPARNPISQFVNALTDPVVRPARRIVPGWAGLDLSTLVLAWVAEFLLLVLQQLIGSAFGMTAGMPIVAFLVLGAISVLRMSVYIYMGALILQAVLSWVAPFSPVMPVVNSLTRPLLRPLQRRVPAIGGVDLSPLVLIIVLQLVLMIPVHWLESMARFALGG